MSSQPAPEPEQTTSTGLDPKLGGLLSYLFGWVSGLVLYLVETQHREIRFHAAQSILLSLALFAVYIPLMILGFIPIIGIIAWLGTIVLGLGAFALWVYMLIQGWNLNHVKLPWIGDMAEDWAAR